MPSSEKKAQIFGKKINSTDADGRAQRSSVLQGGLKKRTTNFVEKVSAKRWPTRSPAVSRTADRTGCQWPLRLSKVNYFHVIWKPICHFLLVINSNRGRISHRFRHMATYRLKIADKSLQIEAWLLLTVSLWEVASALSDGVIANPPPTTYRLATISHDWHTIVRYDLLRSPKVNDFHVIWKPICHFLLVINSNLGLILHSLATIHSLQIDRQTNDTHTISWTVPQVRSAKLLHLSCNIFEYFSQKLHMSWSLFLLHCFGICLF